MQKCKRLEDNFVNRRIHISPNLWINSAGGGGVHGGQELFHHVVEAIIFLFLEKYL